MIESLKKAMLTGVGIAAMSKDKIEEWAKKFAEEAKLAEEEGKKFVQDFVKQSEETKVKLEEQVSGLVQKALGKLEIPSKTEVEDLKKKIAELEEQLRNRQG